MVVLLTPGVTVYRFLSYHFSADQTVSIHFPYFSFLVGLCHTLYLMRQNGREADVSGATMYFDRIKSVQKF